MQRYLGPRTVTGVDFSQDAIDFCSRRHAVEGLSFTKGDAEKLPFNDESFDAVVNVESSHCYGSMESFLREVRLLLRPGGHFLHADLRNRGGADLWQSQLRQSGMTVVRDLDITSHVLNALDQDHERKTGLISGYIPPAFHSAFADFAALRGSVIYEGFRNGKFVYRCYTLRKPQVDSFLQVT